MEACGQLAKLVQESVVKAYEAVEAAWYQRTLDPAFPQAWAGSWNSTTCPAPCWLRLSSLWTRRPGST